MRLFRNFEEDLLDQFVKDVHECAPSFAGFIESLPEYIEATPRQKLSAENDLY